MRRHLAPAFVTTIAALAATTSCKKTTGTGDPPEIHGNPPEPVVTTKKRKRTAPPKIEWSEDDRRPSGQRILNPKDEKGRSIYVRSDDVCVVHDTSNPPKNPGPPGMPWWKNVPVDCPPELDDPAWDHCSEDLSVSEDGSCFCLAITGNPPPPPRLVACPASAAAARKPVPPG